MLPDYTKLVERIMKASGLEKEEIDRRVEAKRAKLSGLVSKEGAAQIVAAELGINFDKEKVKINELMQGMKKANFVGQIIQLFPVREFKTATRQGKVVNMVIADDTGNTKVVLWDTNHIQLIEQGKVKQDDIVEISNASIRNNEVHLTGFSDIKLSNEKVDNVKKEREFAEKKLAEIKVGDSLKTRAVIVQAFEPRYFEVCPECKGRVNKDDESSICEKHGKILPVKRALLNIVLDDGTDNVRAVLFNEQIEKLVSLENFEREKILGKEAFFSGNIRQNKLFNNNELFISDIEEIEIEKLIKELEVI